MTAAADWFPLGARITRADIPGLCADLTELLGAAGGDVVICDVAGAARPDLVTIEALARLRLTAGRHGRRLVVRGAGADLLGLVRMLGLADALPEPGRESEQGEQAGGVEEVVDGRDPPG